MGDILIVIIYFLIILFLTYLITRISSVKKERKMKFKIPREKINPVLNETVRLFVCYLLIICYIGVILPIFRFVISETRLIPILNYVSILYAGFVMIMLCYGEFDYRQTRKIYAFYFKDTTRIKIRKCVLFTVVAIIAVINSYFKYINSENEFVKLINDTYLVSLIAIDRVVNQVYDIIRIRNEKNEKPTS